MAHITVTLDLGHEFTSLTFCNQVSGDTGSIDLNTGQVTAEKFLNCLVFETSQLEFINEEFLRFKLNISNQFLPEYFIFDQFSQDIIAGNEFTVSQTQQFCVRLDLIADVLAQRLVRILGDFIYQQGGTWQTLHLNLFADFADPGWAQQLFAASLSNYLHSSQVQAVSTKAAILESMSGYAGEELPKIGLIDLGSSLKFFTFDYQEQIIKRYFHSEQLRCGLAANLDLVDELEILFMRQLVVDQLSVNDKKAEIFVPFFGDCIVVTDYIDVRPPDRHFISKSKLQNQLFTDKILVIQQLIEEFRRVHALNFVILTGGLLDLKVIREFFEQSYAESELWIDDIHRILNSYGEFPEYETEYREEVMDSAVKIVQSPIIEKCDRSEYAKSILHNSQSEYSFVGEGKKSQRMVKNPSALQLSFTAESRKLSQSNIGNSNISEEKRSEKAQDGVELGQISKVPTGVDSLGNVTYQDSQYDFKQVQDQQSINGEKTNFVPTVIRRDASKLDVSLSQSEESQYRKSCQQHVLFPADVPGRLTMKNQQYGQNFSVTTTEYGNVVTFAPKTPTLAETQEKLRKTGNSIHEDMTSSGQELRAANRSVSNGLRESVSKLFGDTDEGANRQSRQSQNRLLNGSQAGQSYQDTSVNATMDFNRVQHENYDQSQNETLNFNQLGSCQPTRSIQIADSLNLSGSRATSRQFAANVEIAGFQHGKFRKAEIVLMERMGEAQSPQDRFDPQKLRMQDLGQVERARRLIDQDSQILSAENSLVQSTRLNASGISMQSQKDQKAASPEVAAEVAARKSVKKNSSSPNDSQISAKDQKLSKKQSVKVAKCVSNYDKPEKSVSQKSASSASQRVAAKPSILSNIKAALLPTEQKRSLAFAQRQKTTSGISRDVHFLLKNADDVRGLVSEDVNTRTSEEKKIKVQSQRKSGLGAEAERSCKEEAENQSAVSVVHEQQQQQRPMSPHAQRLSMVQFGQPIKDLKFEMSQFSAQQQSGSLRGSSPQQEPGRLTTQQQLQNILGRGSMNRSSILNAVQSPGLEPYQEAKERSSPRFSQAADRYEVDARKSDEQGTKSPKSNQGAKKNTSLVKDLDHAEKQKSSQPVSNLSSTKQDIETQEQQQKQYSIRKSASKLSSRVGISALQRQNTEDQSSRPSKYSDLPGKSEQAKISQETASFVQQEGSEPVLSRTEQLRLLMRGSRSGDSQPQFQNQSEKLAPKVEEIRGSVDTFSQLPQRKCGTSLGQAEAGQTQGRTSASGTVFTNPLLQKYARRVSVVQSAEAEKAGHQQVAEAKEVQNVAEMEVKRGKKAALIREREQDREIQALKLQQQVNQQALNLARQQAANINKQKELELIRQQRLKKSRIRFSDASEQLFVNSLKLENEAWRQLQRVDQLLVEEIVTDAGSDEMVKQKNLSQERQKRETQDSERAKVKVLEQRSASPKQRYQAIKLNCQFAAFLPLNGMFQLIPLRFDASNRIAFQVSNKQDCLLKILAINGVVPKILPKEQPQLQFLVKAAYKQVIFVKNEGKLILFGIDANKRQERIQEVSDIKMFRGLVGEFGVGWQVVPAE